MYQVSAELWKVSVHNEKAGPGFIYGTYDPVVITPLALTSLLPLSLVSHHTIVLRAAIL